MGESSLLTKVAVGLVMFIIIGWATAITTTVTTVTGLEPQIEQIQTTQERHSNWIAEWPSTGELSADVRQNKDIEFLTEEMIRLWEEIDENRQRIRDLELARARQSQQQQPGNP